MTPVNILTISYLLITILEALVENLFSSPMQCIYLFSHDNTVHVLTLQCTHIIHGEIHYWLNLLKSRITITACHYDILDKKRFTTF